MPVNFDGLPGNDPESLAAVDRRAVQPGEAVDTQSRFLGEQPVGNGAPSIAAAGGAAEIYQAQVNAAQARNNEALLQLLGTLRQPAAGGHAVPPYPSAYVPQSPDSAQRCWSARGSHDSGDGASESSLDGLSQVSAPVSLQPPPGGLFRPYDLSPSGAAWAPPYVGPTLPWGYALPQMPQLRTVPMPPPVMPLDFALAQSADPSRSVRAADSHSTATALALGASVDDATQSAVAAAAAAAPAAATPLGTSLPASRRPVDAPGELAEDIERRLTAVRTAPKLGHADLEAASAAQRARAAIIQARVAAPGIAQGANFAYAAGDDFAGRVGLSGAAATSHGAGVFANRAFVGGAYARETPDGEGMAGARGFYGPGVIGFGPSFMRALDQGSVSGSLFVGGFTGMAGPGGSIAYTDAAGRTTGGGFFAFVAADSHVWIEYPDPATQQAKALSDNEIDQLTSDTSCRAHLSKSIAIGGVLAGGYRPGFLGFGGRLHVGRNSRVNYVTHVSRSQIPELIRYKNRRIKYFNDVVVGAGFRQMPIVIPNLAKPESLKVGDELTVDVKGTVDVAIVVDGGLRSGIAVSVIGEMEISARKISETQVQLVVAPKESVQVTCDAQIALLARIFASKEKAKSLRQEFIFDLAETGGRKAYHQALNGKLPVALDGITASSRESDAKALAYYWGESKILPQGVKRGWYEVVTRERETVGKEIGIPGLPWLASYDSATEEERLVTNGHAAHHMRSLRGLSETLRGKFKQEVSVNADLGRATLEETTGEPIRRYDGLILERRFKSTNATEADRKKLLALLRDQFGVDIGDYGEGMPDGPYEVAIQRVLDTDEVLGLVERGDRIKRVAIDAQTNLSHLADYLSQACNVPAVVSDEDRRPAYESILAYDRAQVLQEYVLVGGEGAMAALHRYVSGDGQGDDDKLSVVVGTQPFEDAARRVRELMAEYPEPITAATSTKALNTRIERVKKEQARIESLMRQLSCDVVRRRFAPAQTESQEQSCTTLAQALRNMLQIDRELTPVQRGEVIRRVNRPDALLQAELLNTCFQTLIGAQNDPEDIKQRFKEGEALRERLVQERKDVAEDRVSGKYESASQARRIQLIDMAIEQLEDIMCVAHLSPGQRRRIEEALKPHRMLAKRRGPTSRHIAEQLHAAPRMDYYCAILSERADNLARQFPERLSASDSASDIVLRFEKCLTTLDHTRRVVAALQATERTEYDEDHAALAREGAVRARQAVAKIEDIVSLEHLNAADVDVLLRKVRTAWPVSGLQGQICEALERRALSAFRPST